MLINEKQDKLKIKNLTLGEDFLVIAGPCVIENLEQMDQIAKKLVQRGIGFIRAAAYKPRTSPYSFQGLGKDAFLIIKEIKEKYSLQVVGEIVDLNSLNDYLELFDIIQVGARNMQNFELLKGLGKVKTPILLKRGFGNTIDEFLKAAEYLYYYGNRQVILCERGIRTFETATRNTLDISSVPIIKNTTNLPVLVDPSHASGRRDLVAPLAYAALASGADGLLIEVHHHPSKSYSDAIQTIDFEEFDRILEKLRAMAPIFGKRF
ncbi:MAG: bifunctional 3-deoxy-7-phosphoheptulonate synthase/chorismate mutase [Bacilli bacterium]|nr:bifunctional 3-deoxy-7-phosphoheptulonate synthase/chorismate mutase [Bacilli bacterium]